MRRPFVVACMALIAVLAAVAVPGPVGSQAHVLLDTPSPSDLAAATFVGPVDGPAMTTQPLDPAARSDGNLDHDSTLFEPALRDEPPRTRASTTAPQPERGSVDRNPWRNDPEISWYGPGFIGNGTACGQRLTRSLVGVAHRTLPCGTLITFRHDGRTLTVPVVDRGPYVRGRIFDLTYGACKKLDHCHTGPIEWRYGPGR